MFLIFVKRRTVKALRPKTDMFYCWTTQPTD